MRPTLINFSSTRKVEENLSKQELFLSLNSKGCLCRSGGRLLASMAIETVTKKKPKPAPADEDNSWKTPEFRQIMVDKLDDTVEACGLQLQCTSYDLESRVFEKATCKPEYMILIVFIMQHIRDMGKTKPKPPGHNQETEDFLTNETITSLQHLLL